MAMAAVVLVTVAAFAVACMADMEAITVEACFMAIQEATTTVITGAIMAGIAAAIMVVDIMAILGAMVATIIPPMVMDLVMVMDQVTVMDQAMVMDQVTGMDRGTDIAAEMKTTMDARLVQNAIGIDTTACAQGVINALA